MNSSAPIGFFDSGYGGLTVLREVRRRLPGYDYLYLGDNARAPYGNRSFDVVYEFTRQCVERLFAMGCPLVILACNTASAKALRTIQQRDLPVSADPTRRVLGVIRPTAEAVGDLSRNGHVGIVGTAGTIASGSYDIEIAKLHPGFVTTGHACPMWVPIIENGEIDSPPAQYFVDKDINALMAADPDIDTVILGCTHYPLLADKVGRALPHGVKAIAQGDIVAASLDDYLHRHPEMDSRLSRGGTVEFLTTENPEKFTALGRLFMGHDIDARHIQLD